MIYKCKVYTSPSTNEVNMLSDASVLFR